MEPEAPPTHDSDGEWEDLAEEEEDIVNPNDDGEEEAGQEAQEEEEDDDPSRVRVYLPGEHVDSDDELVCDPTAYVTLNEFSLDWPCLSFDVLRDGLGEQRQTFPMTAYFVAGSQAAQANNNKVTVFKVSNIQATNQDEADLDDDDDSDDEDEGAVLSHQSIKHEGGVNRIRACPHEGSLVATWADTAKVHIFDMSHHLHLIDNPSMLREKVPTKPIFTFEGHSAEGFALDWSPVTPYRLATGDVDRGLHVWDRHEAGTWVVNVKSLKGHTDSIEDIQWSPNEANVFATASVDQTIRVWDVRTARCAVVVKAHNSDVNVLSWNKQEQHLLLSGADDGSFRIWDLRTFRSANVEAVADFKWHTSAITSVQWHPNDPSTLAVAGEDDQVTIWDMAVEPDTEAAPASNEPNVPPQLLFIHQGQRDIKELHWHSQIPGVLVTTAESGFNLFKCISV